MKYLSMAVMILAATITVIPGCSPLEPDEHVHDDNSRHALMDEAEPIVWTAHSDHHELFVEFAPLVVGQISRFAVHFTDMTDFKPVEQGRAIVRMMTGDNKVDENGTPASSAPGIFQMSLTPQQAGEFDLQFILLASGVQDTFTVPGIEVFMDQHAASEARPVQPESGDIAFTKEQAWSIDFAMTQMRRSTIHDVIRTSGNIEPVKGEERIVSSKTGGIVFFKSRNIQPGKEVRAGEHLFSISSEGLLDANLETRVNTAKARLDQAESDFARAADLLAKEIIGQKEYALRKRNYEVAQAEFTALSSSYGQGGQAVSSPIAGIVKNVRVTDGQFVEEGAPLIEITRNRKLILHADVSQHYLPQLEHIHSAHFKTPYQDEAVSIDAFNGRLVTRGQVIESGSGFIPLLFELDNVGQLVPGSFAEVFLLTRPVEDALVVPATALIEEYNSMYVFVQMDGEHYARRQVKIGIDNGREVQIISGIDAGQWVVTQGAYQIKGVSMSSAIPAHGHEH